MNVINLSVPAGVSSPVAECGAVMIGYVGESGVTQVVLDFSTWREAYGDGVVTLGVQRSGDPSWYPVALDVDGTTAAWLVSKTDTNVEGVGVARFAYTVGGAEKRSAVWQFFVDRGLQSPEGDAPDPYESWVETLTELGAETLQNAQDAEAAKSAAQEASQQALNDAWEATQQASYARAARQAAEMAQHFAREAQGNAEAWAVGERGGEPVTDTDPTYLNNARHYALVAQQGADKAGYVFFNVDNSDGEMYVTITENLAQDVTFSVNETIGELEVTVHG